jgi:RNA polymerase sigma factor (TIGR02999 family)
MASRLLHEKLNLPVMAESGHENDRSSESPSEGSHAVDRLLPIVYAELHALAKSRMRGEHAGHMLQTTDLIHEAYLKLVQQRSVGWESRTQVLALAAQAMRRILVDSARHHQRAKRGGGRSKIPLHETIVVSAAPHVDLIALDEALSELDAIAPDHAQLVQLRFFGGLTLEETAEAMSVSKSTVDRNWRSARAWLYRRIKKGDSQN